MMNKRAIKAHGDANRGTRRRRTPRRSSHRRPRRAAQERERRRHGRRLFRDAANDLDMVEDEWRYGIRDDAYRRREASRSSSISTTPRNEEETGSEPGFA